ncbi:MAG: serine hydrolase [Planctomycetota bacterium]|nr:serine hydrolase [Planctomycetota bacterium]
MKRLRHICFGLVALSLVTPSLQAQPSSQDIDALFATWDQPDSPGCAVGVYRDGELLYAKGYGFAQLEYDIPITPTTVFHVASVSKQFTAFAITMLAQQGELSLDDNVRQYVPELPDYGRSITIRHLIHHTSGLRDQWDLLVLAGWRMDDVITRDDVMELVVRQRDLNFEPGDQYTYCNTGYTLLGLIVERVTETPFPQWCEENIFTPLGMSNTHFHDDHMHIVPNRAYSYRMGMAGPRNAVLSYAIAGATSLFTTIEDLAKWQHNFQTAHVGGKTVIEQMMQRGELNDGETIAYAHGLSHGEFQGLPTIGHSGGDAGFRCHLVRFPEQHLSIAVLGNTAMPTSRLALHVASLYLKDDVPTPSPDQSTSNTSAEPEAEESPYDLDIAEFPRFVGRFVHEIRPQLLLVSIRDEQLFIELVGQGSDSLRPISSTTFRLANVPMPITIEFTIDPETNKALRIELIQPDGDTESFRVSSAPEVEDLQHYAGRYYSDELDVSYEVVLIDDELQIKRRKYGQITMTPLDRDRFNADNIYEFTRDASGRIDGFKLSSGRVKNLVFRKLD